MKAIKFKMWRNLFILTGLFLIPALSYSQDDKLSRQERKVVGKAQLARNFYILDSLFSEKSFVLEADFLQNKYGDRVPVTSQINFIRVDGDKGVIQTGNNSYAGYNGVGGETAEGNISNWQIDKNLKQMTYNVRFSIISSLGHYDVGLFVNAANNATATITSLGPGKLSWIGHLATVNNSRVFKGMTTY